MVLSNTIVGQTNEIVPIYIYDCEISIFIHRIRHDVPGSIGWIPCFLVGHICEYASVSAKAKTKSLQREGLHNIRRYRPAAGFGGTNDSQTVFLVDLQQLDDQNQEHTNALVLSNLPNPINSAVLLAAFYRSMPRHPSTSTDTPRSSFFFFPFTTACCGGTELAEANGSHVWPSSKLAASSSWIKPFLLITFFRLPSGQARVEVPGKAPRRRAPSSGMSPSLPGRPAAVALTATDSTDPRFRPARLSLSWLFNHRSLFAHGSDTRRSPAILQREPCK